VDRPNLSKTISPAARLEDWLPLRPASFYADVDIDLRLGTEVASIDTKARAVFLAGGEAIPYYRLLLATGADPVRLRSRARTSPFHVLRSLASAARSSHQRTARAARSDRASFIGLEVGGSVARQGYRGSRFVALEQRPMERVLGRKWATSFGRCMKSTGVIFHLGDTVT